MLKGGGCVHNTNESKYQQTLSKYQQTLSKYQRTLSKYQRTFSKYQRTLSKYQQTLSKYQLSLFKIPTEKVHNTNPQIHHFKIPTAQIHHFKIPTDTMIMFKIPIAQIHHFKIPTALSKYQQTLWSVQNTNRLYGHVHNTDPNPGTPNEQSWYCKHEEWMNEWNELKVKFSWFAFAIGNETLTISPIQYLHILEGHQMLSLDVLSSLIFSGAEWIHCSRFCIILWSKMNCIC